MRFYAQSPTAQSPPPLEATSFEKFQNFGRSPQNFTSFTPIVSPPTSPIFQQFANLPSPPLSPPALFPFEPCCSPPSPFAQQFCAYFPPTSPQNFYDGTKIPPEAMSDSGGGRDGYHMNHPNQGGAGGGNECRSPYGGGSAQNTPVRQPARIQASPISSPVLETRRDFSMVHQHAHQQQIPQHHHQHQQHMMVPQQFGYAIAPSQPTGKFLVDPTTGQQFFVAGPQPAMQYVPVFCNTAVPPSSQPIYFPAQTTGYFVPTSMSMQHQHQQQAFPQQNHAPSAVAEDNSCFERQRQHAAAHYANKPPVSNVPSDADNRSTVYRVEAPPSTAPSVYEDPQPNYEYFQRHHKSRVSTESNTSGSNRSNQNQIEDVSHFFSPRELPDNHHFNRSTLLDSDSSMRHLAPPESSSSGFISSSSRESTLLKESQPPQITRWENRIGSRSSSPKIEERRTAAANESLSSSRPTSDEQQYLVRPRPLKPIRMDIDLNRPVTSTSTTVKPMPVKAAPPTSFMITFNNEEAGSTKPKPLLTLQDAARQAPTGRRLFNRNPETNHRKSDSSESSSVNSGRDATNNDPKRYLFKKMIQGYNSKGPSFDHQSGASDDDYHESDLVSEAGTYVIEDKPVMVTSQTMLDSDQQSDSSSTISDNATESSKPTSTTNRMLPPIGQKPSLQTGGSSNNQPTGQKRSLMSDLRKLREQKTSKVDGHSPRQSAASKLLYPEPEESHGPVSRLCRHPQHKRAELTSTGAFSRADGGRFSMRSPNTTGSRPSNFVFGGKGSAALNKFQRFRFPNATKPVKEKKERPEMIAWLRRKEYDPRKSVAADADKKNVLKHHEAYMSNRSLSFHNTEIGMPESAFSKWRRSHQLGYDGRSNRSYDDLSRLGEEAEEYNALTLGESNSSLQKTVDELTQKCNKSIQLLKLCTQSNLSESVEQLLQCVVEGGVKKECPSIQNDEQLQQDGTSNEESPKNITDRLEKLCSAFDIIQKYLEEQSGGSLKQDAQNSQISSDPSN